MKKNPYLIIVFVLFSVVFVSANTETTLWSENFEDDWTANWHVDAGTWEVGGPTSGPDSAYRGQQCAATVLGGDYAATVSSRLIRFTSFAVPAASENPRLRFWHWYSFSSADYGKVQVKVEGTDDWIDVSTSYTVTGSNIWTYPSIDLSNYAGQTIQLAFLLHAEDRYTTSGTDVSSGWYIDDVEIVTGPIEFTNPEGWEDGIGDWASERGTWQVGIPSSGPDTAYNGSRCAATILGGNYAATVESKLISPNYLVPAASENPRLRFWHWYSFSSADYGKVQVKVDGTDDWIDVSTSNYTNSSSNIWTYAYFPLNDYAGQTIQLAFLLHAEDRYTTSGTDVSSGWYIDDVIIEPNTPTSIEQLAFENFSVYPNPTESVVNVHLVSPAKVEFILINMKGSVIKRNYASEGSINHRLDLSDLPQGIYLLRILSNYQNETIKVIKK